MIYAQKNIFERSNFIRGISVEHLSTFNDGAFSNAQRSVFASDLEGHG